MISQASIMRALADTDDGVRHPGALPRQSHVVTMGVCEGRQGLGKHLLIAGRNRYSFPGTAWHLGKLVISGAVLAAGSASATAAPQSGASDTKIRIAPCRGPALVYGIAFIRSNVSR